MADDSFLRRWSRLKAETRDATVPAPGSVPDPRRPPPAAPVLPADFPAGASVASGSELPVPPTLADVAGLTADSDFSVFVARSVDPAVRRSALRKLFTDPHFNCVDGLDIYMGDYTKPSPMSETMLAALGHARKLFREAEREPETAPDTTEHVQVPVQVAQSRADLLPPAASDLPAMLSPPDAPTAPAAPAPLVDRAAGPVFASIIE
jgi:hypothetical protein